MRPTVLFLVTFAFASILLAQTDVHPSHNHAVTAAQNQTGHVHAQSTPLTGARVPDLIADRLVLGSLGLANLSSATADDLVRQSAFIHSIGLSTSEAASLTEIVNQYAVTWHTAVERYNRDAAERKAIGSDVSQLTAARDDLVTTTMDQIKDTLSPEGYKRFLVYIKNQKAFMHTWEAQ